MPILDTEALAAQMASFAAAWAEKAVEELIAHVNARQESEADQPARDGTGRARDYRTTPGTIRQSHAPWMQGVRDTLIDDVRAARRNPEDATVQFRLTLSSALYAAAGSAYADIVVSADALPPTDPLARPAFPVEKRSRSKALRAEHLSPDQQDIVLDAVSDDPTRMARARASLKRMIAEADDAAVQIAAALLGQIGDPLDRHKLNKLAEQIERRRWNAEASAAPIAGAEEAAPASEHLKTSATPPPDRPPIGGPVSAIVTSGGEHARRLVSGGGDLPTDDPRDTYGDLS